MSLESIVTKQIDSLSGNSQKFARMLLEWIYEEEMLPEDLEKYQRLNLAFDMDAVDKIIKSVGISSFEFFLAINAVLADIESNKTEKLKLIETKIYENSETHERKSGRRWENYFNLFYKQPQYAAKFKESLECLR